MRKERAVKILLCESIYLFIYSFIYHLPAPAFYCIPRVCYFFVAIAEFDDRVRLAYMFELIISRQLLLTILFKMAPDKVDD